MSADDPVDRTPLLAARGLAWRAGGRRILGPLDLEVRRGERLAVVGPNGAGKTTLLRLLAGVLGPSAGRVELRGVPYGEVPRRRLAGSVAYVPQIRPARVPFSVEEMVQLGRYPHLSRWQVGPRREDLEAVDRALDLVGIAGLRRRRVEELSGGEQQSVYIAAALAQEADALILDEPTNHLDPRHQREIAALLRRLEETGHAVVAATHELNFASRIAHRILALRDGRALACARPSAFIEPELLARLFDAPFEVVRGGARPMAVLELDA